MKKVSIVAAFMLAVVCGQPVSAASKQMSSAQSRMLTHDFAQWKSNFKKRAVAEGVSKQTVDAAMDNLKPNEKVVLLDNNQPESHLTFDEYYQKYVAHLVPEGRRMYQQHRGDFLEAEHKGDAVLSTQKNARIKHLEVKPADLIALMGMETNYGTNMGDFNIIQALATLSVAGHENKDHDRRAGFEKELIQELKLVDKGEVTIEQNGSWAGAKCLYQPMPDIEEKFALDADGDGLKSLCDPHNPTDAVASGANYLMNIGYSADDFGTWRVKLPPDLSKDELAKGPRRTLNEWAWLGITQANGDPLPDDDDHPVKLVLLGRNPKAGEIDRRAVFLADKNLLAVNRWNLGYFAGAEHRLAQEIAAPGP